MGSVKRAARAILDRSNNDSGSVVGNVSEDATQTTDIIGEENQLASSENVTMQQNAIQQQIQANSQRPGMYIDNPRRALSELSNNLENGVGNTAAANNNNNTQINRG